MTLPQLGTPALADLQAAIEPRLRRRLAGGALSAALALALSACSTGNDAESSSGSGASTEAKKCSIGLADPDSLQQVLLNLINNSVDAMAAGGRLEIRARLHADARFAEITVRDTGPGLSPEIVEHLFEPMWTTKPTGSGFGLSISREIMAQHGGTLEGDTTALAGAVFIVRVPLAIEAAHPEAGTEVHHVG